VSVDIDAGSVKPLHVKVAEALGCKPHEDDGYEPHHWYCTCEMLDHTENGDTTSIPQVLPYDTDWSATGPLIEQYRICLEAGLIGGHHSKPWSAWLNRHSPAVRDYDGESASGPTPLIAVCHLLIALHEAGKLG
jgi:hypothetical protein